MNYHDDIAAVLAARPRRWLRRPSPALVVALAALAAAVLDYVR